MTVSLCQSGLRWPKFRIDSPFNFVRLVEGWCSYGVLFRSQVGFWNIPLAPEAQRYIVLLRGGSFIVSANFLLFGLLSPGLVYSPSLSLSWECGGDSTTGFCSGSCPSMGQIASCDQWSGPCSQEQCSSPPAGQLCRLGQFDDDSSQSWGTFVHQVL